MHIPSNMTPQNVVSQIEIVVNRIAPKYTFYGYDMNDMKQVGVKRKLSWLNNMEVGHFDLVLWF